MKFPIEVLLSRRTVLELQESRDTINGWIVQDENLGRETRFTAAHRLDRERMRFEIARRTGATEEAAAFSPFWPLVVSEVPLRVGPALLEGKDG